MEACERRILKIGAIVGRMGHFMPRESRQGANSVGSRQGGEGERVSAISYRDDRCMIRRALEMTRAGGGDGDGGEQAQEDFLCLKAALGPTNCPGLARARGRGTRTDEARQATKEEDRCGAGRQ